jgi:hypothetical protein
LLNRNRKNIYGKLWFRILPPTGRSSRREEKRERSNRRIN